MTSLVLIEIGKATGEVDIILDIDLESKLWEERKRERIEIDGI